MNVMKLAWIIFKMNDSYHKMTFQYALTLAWRICKNSKVDEHLGFLIFKSKLLIQYDYMTPVIRKRGQIFVPKEKEIIKPLIYEINQILRERV